MGTKQEIVKAFSSKGLELRKDPALLDPEHYSELTNLVCTQEGTLTVRKGTRAVIRRVSTAVSGVIHSIARLLVNTYDPTNPVTIARYFVQGASLFRTTSAITNGMPATAVAFQIANTASPISQQRITTCDMSPTSGGSPYKFFACPNAMLKDNGVFGLLPQWGIRSPDIPAYAVTTSSGSGPTAFSNQSAVPYKYVYTFRNPATGAEGNPSMYMIDANSTTPNGHPIKVNVNGTNDPQIPLVNGISIYRSGGAFADGLYRWIAYANNTGEESTPVSYLDTWQDSQIASNALLETDNDPPIPSGLPVPFYGLITSYVGNNDTGGAGGAPGQISTCKVQIVSGPPGTDINQFLSPGSIVTVGQNIQQVERCVIQAIDYNTTTNTLKMYFQNDYSGKLPVSVQCSTRVGGNATLCLSAFGCVFIAGDPFNPHVLYQSKSYRPESFPVIENASGISHSIFVGDPSSPIGGLAEFNGAIICLKQESFHIVNVFQGTMATPIKAQVKHGLYSKAAWCQTPSEIWYLSYDGIYSWAGGEEQWRSEQIDPLFHGISVGGVNPIGLGNTDALSMAYDGSDIFLTYIDVTGTVLRLRFSIKFQRWSIDLPSAGGFYAQYVEPDTGLTWLGRYQQSATFGNSTFLDIDNQGTTDGWTILTTDGTAIPYACTPGAIGGDPSQNRLFSDFQVECSGSGTTSVQTYYDFANIADVADFFTIPLTSARARYPFSFHASVGVNAYACQLRFSGTGNAGVSLYSLAVNHWGLSQNLRGLAFDWTDLGYKEDKLLRELHIEMDTGGVPATIDVQGDGRSLFITGQPLISITTTYADRNRIIALPDGMVARMVRLIITPGPGGKTNYYGHEITKFDWPGSVLFWEADDSDLGYDHDKNLRNLTIEIDTGGIPATLSLQGDGNVLFTSTITATIRDRNRVFALPDETIARIVRLQITAGTGGYIRVFDWKLDKWDYPAQLTYWQSDWSDSEWPWSKAFRVVNIDLDTNGLPAQVQFQVDGQTAGTWTVTSTLLDRSRTLTVPDNVFGKMSRLVVTGTAVRTFGFKLDTSNEPPDVSHFDTYSNTLGYNGFTFLKQAWFMYQSTAPVIVTFFGDYDQPFYQTTLPAHPSRDVERFYLPAVYRFSSGIQIYGPVSPTQTFRNKCKRRRICLDTADGSKTLRVYRDATRLEIAMLGSDQRQDYQQIDLGSETFLQAS